MPPSPEIDPVLAQARTARSPLPLVLSVVMVLMYLGFVLLVAFYKPFLGTVIVPGLSWGILLGASIIVAAWLLTLIYVMSFGSKAKGGR